MTAEHILFCLGILSVIYCIIEFFNLRHHRLFDFEPAFLASSGLLVLVPLGYTIWHTVVYVIHKYCGV